MYSLDLTKTETTSISVSETSSISVFHVTLLNISLMYFTVFIILSVSWLHIFCNVSRQNFCTAVTALFNILNETVKQSRSLSIQNLARMPHDPHTLVLKAKIKRTLIETVCCRTCFHLYLYDPNKPAHPALCTYTPFPNNQPCNEKLWVQKLTHRNIKDLGRFPKPPKRNKLPARLGEPRCLFISQPILAWLEWLLSKPKTEAAIDAWTCELSNSKSGELLNVRHGQTFKHLAWKHTPTLLNSSVPVCEFVQPPASI
ncbi:hypothetical protein VP01_637g18 [Puccinia sorghi]|uniref:Uncharacterized protein n=1 Tax=Puccinia sorghi TaxID=27349 RepID=A0A0L6UI41_9BASI|nr:hypothetical protein VP01_637g18 [Puccinia sorghi]